MAAAQSRRPPFRTAAYWAALEAIADDFVNMAVPRAQPRTGDAGGALKSLSSRGFGPLSLFDLSAVLVLAEPRPVAEPADASPRLPAMLSPAEPTAPDANPVTEIKRGPVTVAAHPTQRHMEHLRELEASVAEAFLISPDHPRARSAVRRALMARGSTVQDATVVYGIVCELLGRAPRATS
ncbi:hypothetical protein ACIRQF_30490 [Streptomyces sp. NPDC101191]|uniref:hypothetical protein n=1 Tax=Streptomyces sp. NPDC101191 TaxID=3366126 RepID=UPI00380E1CBA